MLTEPAIAAEIAARFDHLLVDEYQDTNALQGEIVLALEAGGAGPHRRRRRRAGDLFVPRRDRAQHPRLSRAPSIRPRLVVTLERNYRSSGAILAAANAAIALAPERFAKNLWTERPEGALPAARDRRRRSRSGALRRNPRARQSRGGRAAQSQAVLFRASHHSAALELELTRRNVPFVKYGGLKFLDAAHVKDAVALLRFAENPRDRVAGFRVAQLLPGVGPKIAETIVAAAAADDGFAAMAALSPPARARAGFRRLRRPHAPARVPRGAVAGGDRRRRRLALAAHRDALRRRAGPDRRSRGAGAHRRLFPSRERFLSELALDPPDATSDEAGPPLRDEDYLILSTIHSAKGQEWRSVFVFNCVDGCIPSDLATGSSEEIEEERRLLYVAMTRARDELALIVPQRFYVHGQPKYGDRSRVRGPHPLHPAAAAQALRPPDLAGSRARAEPAGRRGPARRSSGAHARDVAVSSQQSGAGSAFCPDVLRAISDADVPICVHEMSKFDLGSGETARRCARRGSIEEIEP